METRRITTWMGAMAVAAFGSTTAWGRAQAPKDDVDMGSLPLLFETNEGQTDPGVSFLARAAGYVLFLQGDAATLKLAGEPGAAIRMRLVGADPSARPLELESGAARVNYLVGRDEARWVRDARTCARAGFDEVWPGIDVHYYGVQRSVEHDFVVSPGADPGLIQLAFEGADDLQLAESGDLVVRAGAHELVLPAPVVFQDGGAGREPIQGAFRLLENRCVGFAIGDYDESRPLVIDPMLVVASYLGGSQRDEVKGIARADGVCYLTGETASASFPTTAGAIDTALNGGSDAFVVRMTPSSLLSATYLGGRGTDVGTDIDALSFGSTVYAVYVTGTTTSRDFPTSSVGFEADDSLDGPSDVFVAWLSPECEWMVASTYLGGTGNESAPRISVGIFDEDSQAGLLAMVTGQTTSSRFPRGLSGPPVPAIGGGDGFVAALLLGTHLDTLLLGGFGPDKILDVEATRDSSGIVWITGEASAGFPVMNGLDHVHGGSSDAFVARMQAQMGSDGCTLTLKNSTYLGGSSLDRGTSIAATSPNEAYVVGTTGSSNFPIVYWTHDSHLGGTCDAFVARARILSHSENRLGVDRSTFLGGSSFDEANAVCVRTQGSTTSVWVAGSTQSADFPRHGATQNARSGSSDAFVTRLGPNLDVLHFSSYFGGRGSESGNCLAATDPWNASLAGWTSSSDLPTAASAHDRQLGGALDGFLAVFGSQVY